MLSKIDFLVISFNIIIPLLKHLLPYIKNFHATISEDCFYLNVQNVQGKYMKIIFSSEQLPNIRMVPIIRYKKSCYSYFGLSCWFIRHFG
ncbi:hypothetical protein HHI36_021322 [Cryptolaemus montrouzieri]|uniref:Uncharacterized protein n=1 Tax=Cryptolaemus montrouzieri TaxID=559131 RepID=A0ABD2MXR8_9CUCU